MLAYNPNERISLSEIANHDWFLNIGEYGSAEEIKAEL